MGWEGSAKMEEQFEERTGPSMDCHRDTKTCKAKTKVTLKKFPGRGWEGK